MPATGFRSAVEQLLRVSKAHAALFLFAPGDLSLPGQRSLKPPRHCGALVRQFFTDSVALSFLFVMTAFASYIAGVFVKGRVPDAAGGGLQGLGAKERWMLRACAALGLLLNVAASVLAVGAYTSVLQLKLGMFACLPPHLRLGVYAGYVVIGGVLGVTYVAAGKAILFGHE